MNQSSEARLAKVHPVLATKVRELITALGDTGLTVEVVQGLRTYEEQDMLFAQGRTRKGPKVTNAKGGQSNHNFGLAVDLCPFVNGQPAWELESAFDRIGAEAARLGLEWGGNWPKFPDRPHVQLANAPSLMICRKIYESGGLARLWERVS